MFEGNHQKSQKTVIGQNDLFILLCDIMIMFGELPNS